MSDLSNFSTEFKKWRIRKGLTQQEVSDRLGISRPVISHLENGNQPPTMRHLTLIKDNYGVDFFHTVTNPGEPVEVSEPKPYFGSPMEMPKDVAAIAEIINAQREVRKDLSIALRMMGDIEEELACTTLHTRKVFKQVMDILIRCQVHL